MNDINKLDEDVVLESHNRKIRPTIYKTFLKVKSLESSSKVNILTFSWLHDFFYGEFFINFRIKLTNKVFS